MSFLNCFRGFSELFSCLFWIVFMSYFMSYLCYFRVLFQFSCIVSVFMSCRSPHALSQVFSCLMSYFHVFLSFNVVSESSGVFMSYLSYFHVLSEFFSCFSIAFLTSLGWFHDLSELFSWFVWLILWLWAVFMSRLQVFTDSISITIYDNTKGVPVSCFLYLLVRVWSIIQKVKR